MSNLKVSHLVKASQALIEFMEYHDVKLPTDDESDYTEWEASEFQTLIDELKEAIANQELTRQHFMESITAARQTKQPEQLQPHVNGNL